MKWFRRAAAQDEAEAQRGPERIKLPKLVHLTHTFT